MNTLFKKEYLLAGVIMAANMFAVNEMKATENKNGGGETVVSEDEHYEEHHEEHHEDPSLQIGSDLNQQPQTSGPILLTTKIKPSVYPQGTGMYTVPTGNSSHYQAKGGKILAYKKVVKKKDKKGYLGFLLYWENRINFFGGALFTLANSFYKFYENKPGFYFDYYFAGWNSNPFAKGYLQFCPNINLGRGGFWLIATFWGSYEYLKDKKSPKELTNTAGLMANKIVNVFKMKKKKESFKVVYFTISILQGFISMPLTVHIAKFDFSISISLDSIIWGIVGMILEIKGKKEKEEQLKKKKEGEEIDYFNF